MHPVRVKVGEAVNVDWLGVQRPTVGAERKLLRGVELKLPEGSRLTEE